MNCYFKPVTQEENSAGSGWMWIMRVKPNAEEIIIGKSEIVSERGYRLKTELPSLLLHSCCGPCSSAVLERLTGEFRVTVYFYNPCITDEQEYIKRRDNQIKLIDAFNKDHMSENEIAFREGPYNPGAFFEMTAGHEKDPEGGDRCTLCFTQRLEKTAEAASMAGYDYFATTLTVSPHKNYKLISQIGQNIAFKYGLSFLDRDFKKKDGFKRSVELSRKYNLYRQNYCGCVFSMRDPAGADK